MPFADLLRQIALDLGKVAPVVEPSELHQAIVVDLRGT
ncbi:hypothetical protein MES4922_10316 [Mesorhizobium ventifaucium]|uniref:Uncharacterized protein n=1 Tax=Mesorhizobium ventifaucium TaxID=666020 RepID=A0ABM9DCY6_9HYPH|nr:hypothetical protein MES4922_10316 [Mesorhizobium ventifaucium]